MYLHLLLVDLADVENLVHEILDTTGIVLNGLQFFLHVFAQVLPQQLVQRTHDERQRRADVVGSVDEEFHLVLVQLLTALAEVEPHNETDDGCC